MMERKNSANNLEKLYILLYIFLIQILNLMFKLIKRIPEKL